MKPFPTFRSPFLIALVYLLAAGWLDHAVCEGQTNPFPFKLKKGGNISMQDAIKLTRRPARSDRITDDALQKIKDANPTTYDRSFKKITKKIMPPRGDLYANSLILGGKESHTVVPKHSILFIPASLKGHLLEVPKDRLILWPQFFKENGNWIQTQEVTFEEARGDDKLSESVLKRIARSGRIVVAVHKGFPISVLPNRPGEATENQKESGATPLAKQ